MIVVYWKDGHREVLVGTEINQALRDAGYCAGSIDAVDFHTTDLESDYEWDFERRQWRVFHWE